MKYLIFFLSFACVSLFGGFDAGVPALYAKERENWSELFGKELFDIEGNPVDLSAVTKKKFIGLYCSASWCPPCRAFTPELIKFYERNKSKIEIILIGHDRDKNGVLEYMKSHKMPWNAIHRKAPGAHDYIRRHKINGIPDFRVFKKNGDLVVAGCNLDAVRKAIKGKK